MDTLFKTYGRLLADTDLSFTRYLYDKINWDNRLIVIKGAKGVGKTTMLLQHIKRNFQQVEKALYVSLDNLWFANHTLLELAEYHYTHGGTHLFLDEVHKYKGWQQEVKNIYDSYPHLHLVVTGSSMLKLEESLTADLSRRHRAYTMEGLSFREYLKLEQVADLPVLSLETILNNHFTEASQITSKVKVLQHFEKYIESGYYPFYREEGDGFFDRLQQVIDTVVTTEIPAVSHIEYDSVYKVRQLLAVLAEMKPYTLNISSLCTTLQSSRNNVLKLLDLMDKAALVRRLYATNGGMNMLTKPEKILFYNTNLMHCLTPQVDSGTMRETYLASQVGIDHQLYMPSKGDLVVDDKWLFEVGGKRKDFSQIKDMEDSFVVSDNMEIGHGNKIPLWLFGFLY
ncbi:MAG: ATP-binding protein [Bacteroidales bacterium]|nr:ATP-binding protein [Bacteroidales bacterium]MBR5631700.1 ATP-binding protein [Bacteroidales bacterium]MBR5912691.1 ATP-binding protein [Bacteroidales bacterium]